MPAYNKCSNCLYNGETNTKQPACVKFKRLIYDLNSSCQWWISQDDPVCEVCKRPTEGHGIYYKGKIYCQNCVGGIE